MESKFTPEEEAAIKKALEEEKERIRQEQIKDEVRIRLLNENLDKPGNKYY